MSALRTWFDSRSLRERRLLVVMAFLLAVTILWAGIVRPVRDGLSSSRMRYADAVSGLGDVEARAAAVRRFARAPRSPEGPLIDTVRARADQAGFTLETAEPDGADRVRVTIASARPGAFFGWTAGLEADGLLIDSLTTTPAGPGTLAIQMTIKARGR